MTDFVHLHNHTDYSLLDAAQTVEQMCNRVYDLGMDTWHTIVMMILSTYF